LGSEILIDAKTRKAVVVDRGALDREMAECAANAGAEYQLNAAEQEGAHGVAVSSYQGGHLEFFKYLIDLLKERGCGYVKVFGGGGITPDVTVTLRELNRFEALLNAKDVFFEYARRLASGQVPAAAIFSCPSNGMR
jgi:methylmalonyl-CoA mutase cobalamin-binding subunit